MKNFLKKYLTEEQLKDVETKYLAEHPDVDALPIYIDKGRLDKVIGERNTARDELATLRKQVEDSAGSVESQIAEAVKKAQAEATAHEEAALASMKAGFEMTEAIYKAHGRNVTAIKALLDPTKKLDEELARVQKSDPYLFEDDIPGGTGKDLSGQADHEDKALAAMRAAVGIY